MKQKIVIKVQMTCDKCRTKAMKIAATSSGVISVGIQGPDKDQLVVIGEGVDSACLTSSLRKKLCYATILTVEEVKPEKPKPPVPAPCYSPWPPPPPHPMYCEALCYRDQDPNPCRTM
ncbi:heavy metal-associated isoprenylated plant protein 47-like isoform X2 [Juglans microcarpa x Juglans regia]|uniref:heavy metal-associated isoprenylated plant protein 47-like isoform X2 n=1 Tax=Juglans microcarpa x Juglans regia TaxID=2249226 RepID=UPI001B7EF16B|nr:heavy metal-associated isoprenylated plant protein 47-like isoform X2 [Juglans microcarpa x Juglans regia]